MSGNRLVSAVLALSTAVCSVHADELAYLGRLQLVHVVFRHGARSPVFTYPTDTFTEDRWEVKWGQLTQLGKEQQWALGAYLRSRYDGFLPAVYSADDVLVRSSDADRAIISAYVLMSAMFAPAPPREFVNVYWQSVPVHTLPEDRDLLLPVFTPPCAAFQAEVEKVNTSIEYQCFKNQSAYLEDWSSKSSGAPAMILYESLVSKVYHGVALPFWSRRMYPQPLSSYNDWNVFFGLASTAPLRRMFVGKLVHEMLYHMKKKAEGALQPDRKLFAYSAHDTNMLALLSALHVWNGILPPFSSCLMIELRLTNTNEHIVTVSYKNDTSQPPHLLKIPGCTSIACPLYEFVDNIVSEIFDEAECEEKSEVVLPLIFHLPTRRVICKSKGGAETLASAVVTEVSDGTISVTNGNRVSMSNDTCMVL